MFLIFRYSDNSKISGAYHFPYNKTACRKLRQAVNCLYLIFCPVLYFRLDQSVGIALSLVHYIYLICLCVAEYEEVVSQQFHLNAGILGIHGLDIELLGTNDLDLVIVCVIILYIGFAERSCRLLFVNDLVLIFFNCLSMISSTRSMDTYISLLTCSERIMLPFTGMVTSIF